MKKKYNLIKKEYEAFLYKKNINIKNIFDYIINFNIKRNFNENIDISVFLNNKKKNVKNIIDCIIFPNNTYIKKNIGLLIYKEEYENNNIVKNFNYVGMNDLIEKFLNKEIKLDLLFSTINSFNDISNTIVNKLKNKINIPNYKSKTLIDNIDKIKNNIFNNASLFKINNFILNISIGKIQSSSIIDLENNFIYLIKYINNIFNENKLIKNIYVNTTMGPSIFIKKELYINIK